MGKYEPPTPERDPGDAVPPGVAPAEPVPLNEQDRAVLDKLRHRPPTPESGGEGTNTE
ncbi:MAG: hypothetical protein JO118_12425 [Acetobacteraceae bacterium]|nr:hypothetical protein [Acetobacteraceae bacterium]